MSVPETAVSAKNTLDSGEVNEKLMPEKYKT